LTTVPLQSPMNASPFWITLLLSSGGDERITPDNQGYYGFHPQYAAYYEVMDYNKLLRDAKQRNKIFFDKLNILGNR
jgi:hypothetical protein